LRNVNFFGVTMVDVEAELAKLDGSCARPHQTPARSRDFASHGRDAERASSASTRPG